MRKHVIFDLKENGDSFDHVIDASTSEEAIRIADREWDYLTDREKNGRSAFFVGTCEFDEDGCPDWDTAFVLKSYK